MASGPRADEIDWLGLAWTLWRRRWFLLGVMASVLAGTAVHVGGLPPAYEAEAQIMLNDRQRQPLPEIEDVLSDIPVNESALQSQLALLSSRGMAERLVARLNLHLLPEFNPALAGPSSDPTEGYDWRRLVPVSVLTIVPAVPKLRELQRADRLHECIVGRVMERITAEPANGPGALSLRFASSDAELAALGANTLAELYLAEQLDTSIYRIFGRG
jgi:uncharacterized protein involved in exopolysaccharide biosynthesis